MRSARLALAVTLVGLVATPALAQDEPEPAEVERVYVPEKAFKRVVREHPRGVVLSDEDLRDLLRRAGQRPAAKDPEAPAPLAATVERLRISGRVVGEVAHLEAVAEVAVLRAGTVHLPLPLGGVGLRSVRLGDSDKAARVIQTRRGPEVLLLGSEEGPVLRTVRWSFAVRAEPGDERGSGRIEFPVPATASGRVELDVPGDVEVARADGSLLWTSPGAGRTKITGAFGGRGRASLRISWRPRRSLETLRSYTVAESRSVFLVQPGVVTLEAAARLEVYRAGRNRFTLRLPVGFVVRALRLAQGEVAYVQRNTEVAIRLNAPRKGVLQLQLRAELATGTERKAETLTLRPVDFEDVDRVAGIIGFASGPESRVTFGEVKGLERDDLGVLGARLPAGRLLRVYRRGAAAGATAQLRIEPVEPKVDLAIKAALAVAEREIRALTLYRYEVEAGSVYSVRAWLPPGFAFETATVRDGSGRAVPHQRKDLVRYTKTRKTPYTEILIELEKGLRTGQALLLTVQATRQVPEGLAGRQLNVPRFSGSPASRVHGHIGFAPDEAFRLDGTALTSLVAIPAEELPRVGVDVAGLVLGYRIEGKAYGGRVEVIRKETQITAEILARHRVHERVIDSTVHLDLEVEGGPVKELELLLPKGTGVLAKIEGTDVLDDRELLGLAADGRERWKIQFDERKLGRFALTVKLATKLAKDGGGTEIKATLPRVSVAGAFAERGTLAVYSSDATEVVAEPTGLRTIEVTEVPARIQTQQRPLFAYTHVGGQHELLLSIRRPGSGEVLTAVAEQLALETSASADGTARHTATWTVKNLNNQFFALRLPSDAVLWSVVVDGQGVKPAKRDGLELIPIPAVGEKGPNQVTRVSASYTLESKEWGVLGAAGLEAPVLLRGHDAVPVLSTRWELSLPDDYRVIEVDGNLRGPDVGAPRPLMLSLLGLAGDRGWPLALGFLALLGLLTAASARLRRTGLLMANGGAGAMRGGAQVLTSPGCRRAGLVLLALMVLAGLGFCVLAGMFGRGGGSSGGAGYDMAKSAPMSPMEPTTAAPMPSGGRFAGDDAGAAIGGEQEEQLRRGYAEGKKMDLRARNNAPAKQVFKEEAEAERSLKTRMDRKPSKPRPRRKAKKGKSGAKDKEHGRRMPKSPPPPPMEAPADDMPMDMDEADMPQSEPVPTPDTAPGEMLDGVRSRLRPAQDPAAPAGPGGDGDASGMASSEGEPEKPVVILEEEVDVTGDVLKGTDLSNLSNKNLDPNLGLVGDKQAPDRVEPTRFGDLGQMGQVGLRSLVMQLPGVGSRFAFERPGGDAQVRLSVVQEAALVTACGFLALVTFLLALVLPRAGKVSTVGLVLVALAALTAGSALAGGAWSTPLSNAAALGVVFAAPVAALMSVGRVWETNPFTRLRKAMRALREE